MRCYADIYIAKQTRSKKEAIAFLDHFLPNREESAEEYYIPQYSEPTEIMFPKDLEVMEYLERNVDKAQNMYWQNLDKPSLNKHGMLFYTKDNALIFGISRNADMSGSMDTKNEDDCFEEMKQYFKTELGYITYESSPEDTFEEFVQLSKSCRPLL